MVIWGFGFLMFVIVGFVSVHANGEHKASKVCGGLILRSYSELGVGNTDF